jgi:hypothetical protein
MTTHSLFSASASTRLMNCPGSYEFAQNFVDPKVRRATVFSAEGTLAHSLAEACVVSGTDPASFLGQTRTADGFDFFIDEEFVEGVNEYVNFLKGLFALGYRMLLERKVSPAHFWPDFAPLPIPLFGTSDCIAYHPGKHELVIGDLKFGKGVPVEVAGNTQTLYYGAGALDPQILSQLGKDLVVKRVRTVIIQPRAIHPDGPIREADYTPAEIRDWSRDMLYPAVVRALEDKGKTLRAGKHCRFCPALPHCPEVEKHAHETARSAFLNTPIENLPAEPVLDELPARHLPDDKLGELLDRIAVVGPWLDAVKQLAQARLEQGRQVPGWKVVPKRALRRFADEDDIIVRTLDQNPNLQPHEFSVRSLLTPAQIEKRIGKKRYAQEIAPHVVKTSSGLTLAPEGDPRTRVRSRTAQEAFEVPAVQLPLPLEKE